MTGQVVNDQQRKYNLRANMEQKALNIFTFGINSSLGYTRNSGLNVGTNGLSGNVTNALLVFPNVPVKNQDGGYNLSADNQRLGRGANIREIDNNYTNIGYILENNIFSNQTLTLNGNAFLDLKIVEGLNVRSQLGVNSMYGEDFQYLNPFHGDGRGSNGSITQQYIPNFNYVWTNTLSFNKDIGESRIQAVGGVETQKTRQRFFGAAGTGLSNIFFGPNNIISNTLATPNIGGDIQENSIRSFFGRVNYSFKGRYLLGLTYRSDYLSSLGISSKPASLPGVSVGYRISDESFFKDSKALSFISELKLRGSYAKTGNSNIGNYPFASTYAPATYGSQSGIAFANLGNPNLVYETVKKIDIGLDLAFFKNRLTITADYYKNDDDNLILAVPIAPSLGVPGNVISRNIGNMYNKGFELSVSSKNITNGSLTWQTDFNISFNRNKVTALNNGQDIIPSNYNIIRVGESLNDFYGYEFKGVNPANGNPLYLKANGQTIQGNVSNSTYYLYDPANPTALTTQSSLSLSDKKILGHATPTYSGGFGNTFTYKGFDLNVFFIFSGGNKVYNATSQENLFNQAFNNNGTEILNRWKTAGQITDVPKLFYGNGNFINLSANATTRFLEDGKFIRAQEMRLGYTLPKSLFRGVNLNMVHLYAAVQNAFVITDYKGLDPEVFNTGTGVDFNANPRSRTFLVGLNVGF